MAWVELIPFGLILLMVAWIFLRPYPQSNDTREISDGDEPPASPPAERNQDKDS